MLNLLVKIEFLILLHLLLSHPIRAEESKVIHQEGDQKVDLLPFSPWTPLSLTPPLVNFISILPTGAERGIDSFNRWTITANIEAGHVWDGHDLLHHVQRFVNDPTIQDSDSNLFTHEYDRHATSVASLIGGHDRNGQQFGIAPETAIHSAALATNWSGEAYSGSFVTTPEAMATAYSSFFGSADVINSSWGGPDPTGTSPAALITDGLANQYSTTTFVTSAGNSGPNANTVGGPGSGYNNIAVGALEKSSINNKYDQVAKFSGRGPQDYSDPVNGTIHGVRAEVDLVAPGTQLTVAHYGGQTGGNHPSLPNTVVNGGSGAYLANAKGTSFASPLVAGAAALILDTAKSALALAHNPFARDARVVKAVLMNSADKLPGWNNDQRLNPNGSGVITTQALDWNSGAGALNVQRALEQYSAVATRDLPGLTGGSVGKSGWDFGKIGKEQTNIYRINEILAADSLFSATLTWFRERAFLPEILSSQEIGHADLDLVVRDSQTQRVVAESISTYNVVEHLYFTLPATSLYQIEVNYSGNLFGALKHEEYGLAWHTLPPNEARARCRQTPEAKPPKPNEPHPPVCPVANAHPIRTGSFLPRGGWLIGK